MRMSRKDLAAISAKTGQHFDANDLGDAKAESKYRNKSVVIDNICFASKHEAEHYQFLKIRQRAKEITSLTVHHTFTLEVQGVFITRFIADFVFLENGKRVVHDTKGASAGLAYEHFLVKKRLMAAVFAIDVIEIRKER